MLAALAVCAALGVDPASSQNVWKGARFGVGVDTTGELAGVGQIEIVSFGDSGSAELALIGFRASTFEEYSGMRGSITHDYTEDTDVSGLGVSASYLFRHGRERRGPYLALGLGLGALDVDWRKASPTDNLGTIPAPGGGAISENRVVLGTMVNVGLGLRLHRNADLRAQVLTLLASSTETREDLKFVPSFTLSAGLGF